VGDAVLSEKASRILRDLELESLRALYRSLKSQASNRFFYLDTLQIASTSSQVQAQQREALWLNCLPRILARRLELAVDGIWPKLVSYRDRGPHDELVVLVSLSERGERVLTGASPAFSGTIRFVRRFIWIGCCAAGLIMVGAYLGERTWRLGWQHTLVTLAAVVGITILTRKLWR
jgi:hypothetical protein